MSGYIVILESGTFYRTEALSQMLIDFCEYGSINIVRLSDGLKMVDATTFEPISTISEDTQGYASNE